MIFVIFSLTKIFKDMKLTDRLNVLIQATTVSQKNGVLTLDDAVKVKTAIDVISSGKINQNFASAINVLIETVVMSQKKGVYSLKDAHMIYLAIDGIENVLQNEVYKINESAMYSEHQAEKEHTQVVNPENQTEKNEPTVITIPPTVLKRNN